MKPQTRVFLAVLGFFLFTAIHAQAASASGTEIVLGHRHTVYWTPPDAKGKQPLILFSHGFKGCGTQTTFLTEALAADGYWVFAPDHDDAGCGKEGHILGRSEESFFHPDEWSETTYTDRADDMRDLVDALQRDPKFKDKIDFKRIGLVGHSLGGYTVLGLAGAWPSWKMPGVKAVLALSPYSQPFLSKQTLGKLDVPVMYQGGTRDPGITPAIKKNSGAYEVSPAPKYFVEFDRANHFAWTNFSHAYRASIIAYSEAFLDHYVKGLPATKDLTVMRSDVAEMEYDSDLGKGNSGTGSHSGD